MVLVGAVRVQIILSITFIYVLSHTYVLEAINMGNMTLSIPTDIQDEMKHFSEVRWSEVARKAIIEKIETLKLAESLVGKSKLTRKDVDEFNKKVKSLAGKRFLA
jgi:hypothetical protein